MLNLIASRIALVVPQLALLSLVVFALTYFVPGSAAAAVLGTAANPESIAQLETQLGLDRPFFERLGSWYAGVLQGDLGTSYVSARPVTQLFAERLPASLSLIGGGLVVSAVFGFALGLLGGTKPGSLRDRISTALSSLSLSIPEFWIGIVLLLVFAVQLGWLPVVSYVPLTSDIVGWLRGMVLPSLSLGIVGCALIARQLRSSLAGAREARYMDSLTAAGVPQSRLIGRYALKNAMVPVLGASSITVSVMIGTSFAIEKVFAFPGIGTLMLRSVTGKDFAVVQGGVLLIAVLVIAVNLLIDIAYGLIDPKARAA
ncbi:ABC transporter permease [Microbacterium sp. NPDC096154]|uniref:ABC transporter permease n=1 Tax=Microbacterium sp. NPDC096154 TaxID=3155549 RepID=UPI00331C0FF8